MLLFLPFWTPVRKFFGLVHYGIVMKSSRQNFSWRFLIIGNMFHCIPKIFMDFLQFQCILWSFTMFKWKNFILRIFQGIMICDEAWQCLIRQVYNKILYKKLQYFIIQWSTKADTYLWYLTKSCKAATRAKVFLAILFRSTFTWLKRYKQC